MINTLNIITLHILLSFNCNLTVKIKDIDFDESRKSISILSNLNAVKIGDSILINAKIADNSGYLYLQKIKTKELIYGNSINSENINENGAADSLIYDYKNINQFSAANCLEPYIIKFDKNKQELKFYILDSTWIEYCKISWE